MTAETMTFEDYLRTTGCAETTAARYAQTAKRWCDAPDYGPTKAATWLWDQYDDAKTPATHSFNLAVTRAWLRYRRDMGHDDSSPQRLGRPSKAEFVAALRRAVVLLHEPDPDAATVLIADIEALCVHY